MADLSELLRLPGGLESSGDPIEVNPFPSGDPRHKVWDDATRKAEEQWCRLSSQSEITPFGGPDVLIHFVCKHFADKFDIWAKRGVHVVWSDGAVRAYDQWLINYAEAWLRDVGARKLYSRLVPFDDLLSSLRLVLTKRVNWWKAEARRYLAEQKADSAKENPSALNFEPEPPSKPKKGRPPSKLAASRREVIQEVAAKGLKGAEYCKALDKISLHTSVHWQKNEGCPKNYLDAYHHADRKLRKKWRDRIANEKYLASRQK